MANVKKGQLTTAPQWWKHLRPFSKRHFWKRERNEVKCMAKRELEEKTKD